MAEELKESGPVEVESGKGQILATKGESCKISREHGKKTMGKDQAEIF